MYVNFIVIKSDIHIYIHTSPIFAACGNQNIIFVLRRNCAEEIASQFEVYLDILVSLNYTRGFYCILYQFEELLYCQIINNSLTMIFKIVPAMWRTYLSSSLDITNFAIGANNEHSSQASGNF